MGNHNSGRKRISYSTEKGKELLAKADPESAAVIIGAMRGERVSELQFKAATTIYVHNHGQAKQGHEFSGDSTLNLLVTYENRKGSDGQEGTDQA